MKCKILIVLALFLIAPCAYSQQQKNKIDYKSQSYDMVFDKPNCILSVIPLDALHKIKSLTIRGELGNDDVSIIFDKCTDLEYLDLKNTSLKTFNVTDFSKVSKLRVFKMPSKVQRLKVGSGTTDYDDLFKNCLYLEEVELPSDLVYIHCNLFNNCPKITTITIPAKVHELISEIKSCSSLTIVDLSQCTNISQNGLAGRCYRLRFKNCPNIKIIKFQSGDTREFGSYGEPSSGVCYYFTPNPDPQKQCIVRGYKNSTLFFKREATNSKDNPVKNCTIYCPKSMITHFYVEFNEFDNEVIGLTKAEMEKEEQRRMEQVRQEQIRSEQVRQEQKRREQERLERERQAEAKRKREADSIARVEARLHNLKTSYSSCRFLFATDAVFVSCITQESSIAIENKIKTLIDQKMEGVSYFVVEGTEFKDQDYARNIMEEICDIPENMKYVNASIAEYAENKIQDFVGDRKVLSKAYDKAKKKDPNLKCSEFLTSYINDDPKSSNGNRKSSTEATSSLSFAMASIAYSNAPQYSFGLTVGSVKKLGWYVSLNSDISSLANNFKYNYADYECNHLGTINELTTEYSYSGNKRSSRLGATAGVVFKISGPVYAYSGGGYGLRNMFWELENGKWAKCTDDSYQGITLDAGLMLNSKNYGLSFGVQTIGVKYMEVKIGIGFTLKRK